jgi:hypothetical protein
MLEPEKTYKQICAIRAVHPGKPRGRTFLVHPLAGVVTYWFSLEDPRYTSIFEHDQAIRITVCPDAYYGYCTTVRKERIGNGYSVWPAPPFADLVS